MLAAYARVWGVGWLYDDAGWLPSGPFTVATAPFAAAVWIGGGLPWGVHGLLVLLHLVNGLLLWTVTAAWFSPAARTLVLMLFWLHPLQVEGVAYASGGVEVLLTTYVLIAWWASQRGSGWWVVSALSLCLGARLKFSAVPILLVVPVAIAVARRVPWDVLGGLLWLGGLVGAVIARPALMGYAHLGDASARLEGASTLALAGWRYLAFILVPSGFSIEHDWAAVPVTVRLCALVAAFGVGVVAWGVRQSWPALGWAWLWIVGLLAPRALTLPAAPPLTEHHTYLPFLAIWLLVGAAWDRLVVHVPLSQESYA